MTKTKENAVRIQTSILNAAEKKALIWLAERQPKWVNSDMMTCLGTIGAIVIALGYALVPENPAYLWLSSLGFVINWYGDSLDGTLARVRKCQRPLYGYYLDHTMDAVNELIIFVGLGLSGLMDFSLALLILVVYLMLTINVSINAHLKQEFRLTYLKLGPTEFRILAIVLNTLLALLPSLREYTLQVTFSGHQMTLGTLDIGGCVVLIALALIYLISVITDARGYARIDPPKKSNDN